MRHGDMRVVAPYTMMNLAKHGYWSFFATFGLIYFTDVLAVAPEVAGGIILASLVFDAVLDPVAGSALEWVRSRQRDYQAIVLGGAAASALCLVLVFNTHGLANGVVAAAALTLAFRAAFTVYDLGDNALAARITALPQERTTISAARKAAAALASMATGATAGYVASDAAAARANLPLLAAAVAVASLVLAAIGYRALRDLDRAAAPLPAVSSAERARALLRSKDALILSGLSLIEAAATPIVVGGFIYFSRALTGAAHWAGVAVIVLTLTQIASLPMWAFAAERIGKRGALAASHGLTALASAWFACGAGTSPTIALVIVGAIGAAVAGVSTMRWSLAPDFIDAASKRGVRIETSLIGLISGAVQVGSGVAAASIGIVLAASGYVAEDPERLDPRSLALALAAPVALAHGLCAVIALAWRSVDER